MANQISNKLEEIVTKGSVLLMIGPYYQFFKINPHTPISESLEIKWLLIVFMFVECFS